MKKKFIVGIMIASSALSFSAHAVETERARPVREVLKDYVKDIREYAAKTIVSANKNTPLAQKIKAEDLLMKDLELRPDTIRSLKTSIAGSRDKKAMTNSLVAILAAKKLTAGKSDAESTSINNAADASLKLMENGLLIGWKTTSTFLPPTELQDTNAALTKLVAMPEKFITFETKERDSYTKIILKADELSVKAETYEEAFVKAIMEVQVVSKEKALEIIRKLKDCV